MDGGRRTEDGGRRTEDGGPLFLVYRHPQLTSNIGQFINNPYWQGTRKGKNQALTVPFLLYSPYLGSFVYPPKVGFCGAKKVLIYE